MTSKYQEGCKVFRLLMEGCYDESTHGKVELLLKDFIGGVDISNPGQDAPQDTRGLAMWIADSVTFLRGEVKLFEDDVASVHADVEDGEGGNATRFVIAGDDHWPLFHRFYCGKTIAAYMCDVSDVDELFDVLVRVKQQTDELTIESFNAMTFADAKTIVAGTVKHFTEGAELKMAKHFVSSGMLEGVDALFLRQFRVQMQSIASC